jgi:sec-independent protein translocase protein TatA
MLGDLGGWHLLIILAVILLLFGATKLPALAKGVGQSVRIFRNEMSKTEEGAKRTRPRPPRCRAPLRTRTPSRIRRTTERHLARAHDTASVVS